MLGWLAEVSQGLRVVEDLGAQSVGRLAAVVEEI